MAIFVAGLSYRSAPLSLLERLAIGAEEQPKALAHLVGREHVQEAVIVSTCNRTEVYASVTKFHAGATDVRRFLAEFHFLELYQFADHLYDFYEEAAVQHLFSVAAGVDSLVVGEAQVISQMRSSLRIAEQEATAGPVLGALFRHAVRVGKRVRTETEIGSGLDSTLSLGLEAVVAELGPLAGKRVVLVGAGSMGKVAGKVLREARVGELVIANRTPARGQALARAVDGRCITLEELPEALVGADLVVACTAATQPMVGTDAVASALSRRGGRGLFLLDLGVPRDVAPGVRELPGVQVLDLEGLRRLAERDDHAHAEEIARARGIVAEETRLFCHGQRAAELGPTIRAIRQRAEQARQQEVTRALGQLRGLDERQVQAVEQLSQRLVNKLLHQPVVRGKRLAAGPDGELYAGLLRELYVNDDDDDRR